MDYIARFTLNSVQYPDRIVSEDKAAELFVTALCQDPERQVENGLDGSVKIWDEQGSLELIPIPEFDDAA